MNRYVGITRTLHPNRSSYQRHRMTTPLLGNPMGHVGPAQSCRDIAKQVFTSINVAFHMQPWKICMYQAGDGDRVGLLRIRGRVLVKDLLLPRMRPRGRVNRSLRHALRDWDPTNRRFQRWWLSRSSLDAAKYQAAPPSITDNISS